MLGANLFGALCESADFSGANLRLSDLEQVRTHPVRALYSTLVFKPKALQVSGLQGRVGRRPKGLDKGDPRFAAAV